MKQKIKTVNTPKIIHVMLFNNEVIIRELQDYTGKVLRAGLHVCKRFELCPTSFTLLTSYVLESCLLQSPSDHLKVLNPRQHFLGPIY